MVKESSMNGNDGKKSYVASKRRPGRPTKKPLHCPNPLPLSAPENNISQITEKESSEIANVTLDNRPSFFKIILDNVKERMRIPPKFLHHMLKDLTKIATLKIFSKGVWTVKINNTKDGVFMEDGWQQFLRDNSLTKGHFLVFTYDGNMSFSVQIFEVNGIERIHEGLQSTTKPPQEGTGCSNNGKGPRGRPRKNRVQTPNLHILPAPKS